MIVSGVSATDAVTAIKSTDYQALVTDYLIRCSIAKGGWTLTLPPVAALNAQVLVVKVIDLSTGGLLKVVPNASDTLGALDGTPTAPLVFTMGSAAVYDSAWFISEGSTIWTMVGFTPPSPSVETPYQQAQRWASELAAGVLQDRPLEAPNSL